ncbi:MAG: hypothetical protein COA84_06765 [Robiginitomaculum sp.]|nr:MAG: hypothetical protein COA84_06765 [Robiginitomaculum sp.]
MCENVAFTVYFEWDKSDLTAAAHDLIASAANKAQRCTITLATVTGYTDKSGSKRYNVGLSKRRAEIVRGELVSRGVNGGLITIDYKGESDPAVQTPDGAREPLNRRSAVFIQVR